MAKWKIELVNEWKTSYKWITTKLCILGITISSSWDLLPALQQSIPPSLYAKIITILFIIVIIGRNINQGSNEKNAANNLQNNIIDTNKIN